MLPYTSTCWGQAGWIAVLQSDLGVLLSSKLTSSQKCARAAKVIVTLGSIWKRSPMERWLREMILPLSSAPVWHSCTSVSRSGLWMWREVQNYWSGVQEIARKLSRELGHFSYEEGWDCSAWRRVGSAQTSLMYTYTCWEEVRETGPVSFQWCSVTRDNRHNVIYKKLPLNIGANLLLSGWSNISIVCLVRLWSLYLWSYLKSDRTWLWGKSSLPCFEHGVWTRWFPNMP